MEEDEDTYGFGSFSDLFDARPAQAAKRLDLSALSRFCMSERLLSRFQQQQRRRDKQRCVLFPHVAAKFDGVAIDGGLGALGVAPLEGGGVVWLQTAQSDSDALERRTKELRDITNRREQSEREHKSAAALFVAVKHVAAVQPTTVQNTVQGVELKLGGGNRLELTFMPGPFAGPTHRDEFLEGLKKQMSGGGSKEEALRTDGGAVHTPSRRGDAASKARRKAAGLKTPSDTGTPNRDDAKQKEELRQLVRRYTKLDQLSGEGLGIAEQVHAGTGYHLGPTTKDAPKFSADSEYRKRTVGRLTGFLKRMNQEWSEADAHRELHTKAKHSRNEDDLFEYTDTVTGVQIPPRTYEQRYLEYVKAHEVNPVLHMFPVQERAAKGEKSTQSGTAQSTLRAVSAGAPEPDGNARSLFMAILGIDISSSCIIDMGFFSFRAAQASPDVPRCRDEDAAFRAAVNSSRANLCNSWGSTFAQVPGNRAHQVVHDNSRSQTQSTVSILGHSATRKRPRDRRRSLALPDSNDLQSTVGEHVGKSSQDASGNCTASSGGDSREPRTKRSRPTAHKSDTAQKSRRKARRQSIVSTVELPSVVVAEGEKQVPDQRKTPQNSRKSPRPRHPANGYARETSSLEMVGDEDSDLCQLCYSEQALVHMKPCDHAVCTSCWSRLSPSSGKNGTASRRVCPWDREVVTKR
ncbi:hypothetical protein PHYPSEUDO_000515 [Phytophthora pseudosyringae]|uniref:RING-type domain-containing protein n=1 Tax=Phytophthora pseudosyringae TaxID=221518 RepID=A0A8T1W2I2_9STRA|nr:hypothetical protein PHYPSEUDO_000515 [Phytophthora pseudosyringae]